MNNMNSAGGRPAAASQVSSAAAIAIVIVVVLAVVGIGWWWLNRPSPKPTNVLPAGTQQTGTRTPRPIEAN